MNALAEWTSAACSDLGLTEEPDRMLIADIARHASRAVSAPAAPVTAYLFGLAVGRGLPPADAARRLTALAARWRGIDWRD
ncbi:DUF6457 domain-containing protein [Amycolatopsis aidingensis]|uniref:DUF6457 domain-containing protein n=1 Tax=Amycolatopsis aidingensis TaxID=2842453 RepID=UPI001C0E4A52|nr:DUF6457 domain-containing protein [Amycolatopsis aidingensis]